MRFVFEVHCGTLAFEGALCGLIDAFSRHCLTLSFDLAFLLLSRLLGALPLINKPGVIKSGVYPVLNGGDSLPTHRSAQQRRKGSLSRTLEQNSRRKPMD